MGNGNRENDRNQAPWENERGPTLEDKMNSKLMDIEQDLNNGRYSACYRVPSDIELLFLPKDVQAKARRLREICNCNGLVGWLMANKILLGAILIFVALSWMFLGKSTHNQKAPNSGMSRSADSAAVEIR